MRYGKTRKALLFWTLFIGLGAVYGSTMMFIRPDGSLLGMETLLPYFKVLPLSRYLYNDYVFPGIALLSINGIPNLIASYLIIRKRRSGIVLGTVLGITLMLWIAIQFIIFPPNPLSTAYFIFGFIQMATGYAAYVFLCQESMDLGSGGYENIGKDGTRAVVFFSRLGYTKRLAYEEAERTGADIICIRCRERTEGTLGFWWCGRFAMHRWPMAIDDVDISRYSSIHIFSPIWVFTIASPIREFMLRYSNEIKEYSLTVCHFQPAGYRYIAKEAEKLIGRAPREFRSYSTRLGKTGRRHI